MRKIIVGDVTYVQAWECVGPEFSGLVYDQSIMLDKMGKGCNVQITTIVRRPGQGPEFLPGALVDRVATYRHGDNWAWHNGE